MPSFFRIIAKLFSNSESILSYLEKAAVKKAVNRVVESGSYHPYSGHPELKKFEEELSRRFGNAVVFGVSSGTDAIIFALRALGVGSGDEVIVPAFSFISTASAVKWVGAKPVFVDINAEDYNINSRLIEKAITPKTKAVIAVHLFGQPAAMEEILVIAERHNLRIIEDAAQSFGAEILLSDGKWYEVGTIGDIGCMSFSPTKPFSAPGSGGALIFHDESLRESFSMMRDYGARRHYYDYPVLGLNGKLHEIHAAALRIKLLFIDRWIEKRRRIAEYYSQRLTGIGDLKLPKQNDYTRRIYYRYVIRTKQRDQLFDCLSRRFRERYLKPWKHYPVPLPYFNVFKPDGYKAGVFPESERAAAEVLDIPIDHRVSFKDVELICDVIEDFFKES